MWMSCSIGTKKYSIKALTKCERRARNRKPIHKMIHNGDVLLPQIWSQFIGLDMNKADIADYFSNFMIEKAGRIPDGCELVVGGGFADKQVTKSTVRRDIPQLESSHKEADTRIVPHALDSVNCGYKKVLVDSRDTGVHFC